MKTPLFRLNWREGNGVQNDAKHIHDLVVKMTQLDPHQRISARDCKAHPYLLPKVRRLVRLHSDGMLESQRHYVDDA